MSLEIGSVNYSMYTFVHVRLHVREMYRGHSCILTMNKMSLAVTQVDRLLAYKEKQTDLWLDQFMHSVHNSTIYI